MSATVGGVEGAAAPQPTLFLRNATGLVKAWSGFDAFIYSFMSVNLVTLGFYTFSFLYTIPSGNAWTAVIVGGVFVTFLVITYSALVTVMPRAGGDYTWQSRVLGGGPAFVLAMTGWWFILWHWTPIYASILNLEVFAPISATIGRSDWATSFSSNAGPAMFLTCLVVLAFVAFYVTLGMEGYAKLQKAAFWSGLVGLAIIVVLLLFNDNSSFQAAVNREAGNLFGAQGNAYQQTLDAASKAGFSPSGFNAFSLGPTLLVVPWLMFYLLWPNWGATLYGEVRGTRDYRRIFTSMFFGLWVTVVLSIVVLVLMARTFGWEWYNAASSNYWGAAKNNPLGVWPHPVMLAGWLVNNHAFQIVLLVLMSVWFWGWSGTLFLSSTRVIFAAAFDRVLPEWAAAISAKRRVPYGALLLMVVPSLVVSGLFAFLPNFSTLVLDATLVIAVTYLGTIIAAAILPWRRRSIFESSPLASVKLAGIPVITLAAVVTGAFLVYNLVKWITDATYGVNNQTSYIYMAVLYVLAIVVYVVALVVRRRQGIDLARIHAEIPVE